MKAKTPPPVSSFEDGPSGITAAVAAHMGAVGYTADSDEEALSTPTDYR